MKMRVLICATLALGLWAPLGYAVEQDAILGVWITEEGDAHVEITKSLNAETQKWDGTYCGTIIWLKDPCYRADEEDTGQVRHDKNNPDPDKRATPIMGLKILQGMRYDGDKVWGKGTVYDPENGKTYKGKLTLKDADTINMRGYIGISLLGRTSVWVRCQPDKEPAAPQEK